MTTLLGDRYEIWWALVDGLPEDIYFEAGEACCMSCACAAFEDAGIERYVYWHEQDDMHAFDGEDLVGTLHIRHSDGEAALAAVDALRDAGFSADWAGDEGRAITVEE